MGSSSRYSLPLMVSFCLPFSTSVPTPVGVRQPPRPPAAAADALGKGALRDELDIQLAGEHLIPGNGVQADVGGLEGL